MNWTRKEVKERAKAALKRNYWKAVFVSFIFILLSNGASSPSASSIVNNGKEKTEEIFIIQMDEAEEIVDSVKETAESASHWFDTTDIVTFAVMMTIIMVVFVVLFIVFMVIDVFLVNPLWIGAQRFMLKSVDDRGSISELGYTFDHNYLNGVKTAFMRELYIFLWALLFIIPGIYKKYQYYMVEFILAENPDMPWREALQRSKDMMEGQKWNTFVLDLSFFFWHMLSFFTCGISEIAYVIPYVNLTRAALFRELSGKPDGMPYSETRPAIESGR